MKAVVYYKDDNTVRCTGEVLIFNATHNNIILQTKQGAYHTQAASCGVYFQLVVGDTIVYDSRYPR